MPLGMILRRMWRERRLYSVLLLAVCLVTGFFALGPLYVRAVSEAGIRYAIENTPPGQLNITLSSARPLGQEVWEILARDLSGVVTAIDRIARSSTVVNGFVYTLGEPTFIFTPPTDNDYQIVAYSNMRTLFRLVEGRWPVRLAPPEAVASSGMSADEMAASQVGEYSRGEVEAVISTTAADVANLEIGNRFVVGADPTGPTAVVRIVGLVEPAIPLEDPFWEGQRMVVSGRYVPISLTQERYDFGLIVPEGAFEDWIAPTTKGNTYVWTLTTDSDVVHADTLDELEARLTSAQSALLSATPDLLIFSGLADLIRQFRSAVAQTEGPLLFLSGAVLILMLYHLVTTVALVLEQQNAEWASIISRGGSLWQLLRVQLFSMSLLGLVGLAVGPFVAQVILLLLEKIGPLARTLDGASLGLGAIPRSTFVLSGAAAVLAVLVLTLPAWPAARRSLLRLKQLISRPPTRPAWARYYLDLILLLLGIALMLRLYFLISGNVQTSLDTLLRDPASLIRLIASGAGDAGGLNDPFNLLGPALLLTGAALLWLRIFPMMMRALGRLLRTSDGLTGPLALWSVERDPGHYAQLVLLLIGTLALGTASLALEATRDVGAWALAREETGGVVRLEFDPLYTEGQPDWQALPGVTAGESLLVARTPHRAGQPDTALFGLEPETFAASFPEQKGAAEPLMGVTAPLRAGLVLPDDTMELTVQVYAEPTGDEMATETILSVELVDALGIPASVTMAAADPTVAGEWMTYAAPIPVLGHSPWRLAGFRMQSQRGDLQDFSHTVYIDDVRAIRADGSETLAAGFEAGEAAVWAASTTAYQLPDDLQAAPSAEQAVDGSGSLRVTYRVRRVGGGKLEPIVAVDEVPPAILPLVASRSFAEYHGARSRARQPFTIGDEGLLELNLANGPAQFRYRIVGIIEGFPTTTGRDLVALTALDPLRLALNRSATVQGFYDWNQAWLMRTDRRPDEAFASAAASLPGFTAAVYAWDRFSAIQRDPLANALTGMLFAGFWVSLLLSVLDFAFYLAVTAHRRALSFAVLQAIGWDARNIWSVLAVEQTTLIVPAMLVGMALGAALAYLLLPFLGLIGGEALRFPARDVAGLLFVLAAAFAILLGFTAAILRRQSISQVLRLGEE